MHNAQTPSGGQPENLPAETSATFNATAEAARLLKTIALADEAIRCAADHRSADHAEGETIEETRLRWFEANEIEAAAQFCRKAARSALKVVEVFPVFSSAKTATEKIEEARAKALGLKAVIDEAQRANANRQIRILARQIAAAVAADRANIAKAAAEAAEADEARAEREAAAEAARLRDDQIKAAAAAPDSPAEIARRAAANKRRLAALKKGGLL